jgi:Cu(I)/Ag(I) efflux system membrane protein CusA/SilA
MNLAIAAVCFGITIVGLYTIYIHKQLNKLLDEYETFRKLVQKGFTAVHKDIELALKDLSLKDGYYIHFDGQLEKQQKGMLVILLMALISILGIYLVLFLHFKSHLVCLQILLNIPLALIGSVFAVFITDRVFTLASLVAFVTLCGIASRNGIMMISHYIHLIKYEKETFSKDMVIKGSLERLVPVLMTALTAMLALIPILLSKGEPGKEILYPLSVVIVGGLFNV